MDGENQNCVFRECCWYMCRPCQGTLSSDSNSKSKMDTQLCRLRRNTVIVLVLAVVSGDGTKRVDIGCRADRIGVHDECDEIDMDIDMDFDTIADGRRRGRSRNTERDGDIMLIFCTMLLRCDMLRWDMYLCPFLVDCQWIGSRRFLVLYHRSLFL